MNEYFDVEVIFTKNDDIKNIEENEFRQLVTEVAAQGLIASGQVSKYIVRNQLGYKYENISGILEMKKAGDVWGFKGVFPKKIYARLCQELNLKDNGSTAKLGKFTSFKDSK
ncbi:hypothetical protein [Serratia quinivorans]|uniref:hypothetical protein n=1 Tax=Serratia quinivorans TaxID=137545 RepID=UPI003F9B5A30